MSPGSATGSALWQAIATFCQHGGTQMTQAELTLIAAIVVWGVSIWVGDIIAKDRGRHNVRFVISSFFFRPLAVLVMLDLQTDPDALEEKKEKIGLKKWCVYCGESLQASAVIARVN